MEKQPAKKNYFFGENFTGLKKFIQVAFEFQKDKITDYAEEIADAFEDILYYFDEPVNVFPDFLDFIADIFLLGVYCGAIVVAFLIAPIFHLIFFIPQALYTVISFLVALLVELVVSLIDKIYRLIKGIGVSCPSPSCQVHIELPAFVCTCGRKHTKLVPSRYGIFKRECLCGRLLPTTFMSGRSKITRKVRGKWVCPHCGNVLGHKSVETVDITIPVTGGPASGKTCFLTQSIIQISKKASRYGLKFEYYENKKMGDDYKYNKEAIKNGYCPSKTNDYYLRYYQFFLYPKGDKTKNLISICDIAGEAFDVDKSTIGSQIGFKNAQAFLIVVDPLTIKLFRDEVIASGFDFTEYLPSYGSNLDEIISVLITNLENLHVIKASERVDVDVAIVFTKCDLPALDKVFGVDAIDAYRKKNNIDDDYVVYNEMCKEFLIKYGESNFLNSLTSKFKSVQFFTCSALGHVSNGQKFTPTGVEEPILWLIDKESAAINLKDKWGKKI